MINSGRQHIICVKTCSVSACFSLISLHAASNINFVESDGVSPDASACDTANNRRWVLRKHPLKSKETNGAGRWLVASLSRLSNHRTRTARASAIQSTAESLVWYQDVLEAKSINHTHFSLHHWLALGKLQTMLTPLTDSLPTSMPQAHGEARSNASAQSASDHRAVPAPPWQFR